MPKLDAGTGQNTADAVHELISKWSLLDNKAVRFDITSVNTGHLIWSMYFVRDRTWLYCSMAGLLSPRHGNNYG